MNTDTRFLTWLRKQCDRDDAVGDLSNDVRADSSLCYKRYSARHLETHMRELGACGAAIEALSQADREYTEFAKE